MQTKSGGKWESLFNASPLPHTTKAPNPSSLNFCDLWKSSQCGVFYRPPVGWVTKLRNWYIFLLGLGTSCAWRIGVLSKRTRQRSVSPQIRDSGCGSYAPTAQWSTVFVRWRRHCQMQTAVNQRNYRQHQVTLNWVLRRSKKYLDVDCLSDRLSRCFELGFILIKQLLWKGAVENKSSEWVLSQLRGSAAITRRNNPAMLQRKVLCFSGHCQGSKSKSHIIYNTRHICWPPVMLPPPPLPKCWFTYHPFAIGHFRVPPGLGIKTRLSAQPLIWKWFFILMQMKLVFTRTVVHLVSFWKWGFLELGSGLLNSNLSIGQGEKKYSRRNVKYVGRVGMTWKILTFGLLFQPNLTSIVGHFYIAVPYIDGEATLYSSRTSTF